MKSKVTIHLHEDDQPIVFENCFVSADPEANEVVVVDGDNGIERIFDIYDVKRVEMDLEEKRRTCLAVRLYLSGSTGQLL